MNGSGDAAEQVVRLSLEGTEVVLKLTGTAAKNIAAALYTILKNKDKNKIAGHQRLTAMLKSGKELKVFSVGEEHLKQFTKEAKRYGVVYCALKGTEPTPDGLVDIMCRAEDASKINRIVERFKMATVDAASIRHDVEQSRAAKTPAAPEQAKPEKDAEARVVDDLMGKPIRKEERESPNPSVARTEKSPPSAPTSGKQPRTAEGTSKKAEARPSVREELREIRASRQEKKEEPARKDPERSPKAGTPKVTEHKQPQRKKKNKTKAR
ncbi:MAG: PcfB family protein [Anaerovoracaceae bacterium]|jgi:hypothetical protein